MQHRIKTRKLNRTSAHRKALLINLSSALLTHEMIKTTLPKAKELRVFVEKIITLSKTNSLPNRRRLLSIFDDEKLISKLFSDIGKRVENRNGGYVRIIHNGFRTGDKAPMAIVELVDRNNESGISKESSFSKITSKTETVKKKKKSFFDKTDTTKKKGFFSRFSRSKVN